MSCNCGGAGNCGSKCRCDSECNGLKKVVIPAVLGDDSADSPVAPCNGAYHNTIVEYEANGVLYVYSSDGIYTKMEGQVTKQYVDQLVEAEADARKEADADLEDHICTVEDALAEEIEDRKEADEELQDSVYDLDIALKAEQAERAQEDIEINQRIDKEVGTLQRQSDDLSERVETIEGKIPNAASKDNQLADKDFVNSSVSTNTAYYISDNGEPFESVEALEAYEGDLTNNDYAFVTGTDADGNTYYDRYKYNAEEKAWAKEYRLNNSSFTADQWAAINSGITSALIASFAKQSDISSVRNELSSKANASDVESLRNTKQDKLVAGDNITITGNTISATGGDGAERITDEQWTDVWLSLPNLINLLNSSVDIGEAGRNDEEIITNLDPTALYGLTGLQVEDLANKVINKQDRLVAGSNITISGNTISATGGSSVDVVQTTGTSTSSVMSQKAVTDRAQAIEDSIYQDSAHRRIAIGNGATTSYGTVGENRIAIGPSSVAGGNSAIAFGPSATSYATGGIAIGARASVNGLSHDNSIAIGADSRTSGSYEVSFGGSDIKRKLINLADGTDDHHAVTLGQMNEAIASIAPSETNIINEEDWETLWQ